MSRYTGPQQRGAERVMRDARRREAEARQADERRRYAQRRAEQQAPPRPLTDRERDELVAALLGLQAAHILAGVLARGGAALLEEAAERADAETGGGR